MTVVPPSVSPSDKASTAPHLTAWCNPSSSVKTRKPPTLRPARTSATRPVHHPAVPADKGAQHHLAAILGLRRDVRRRQPAEFPARIGQPGGGVIRLVKYRLRQRLYHLKPEGRLLLLGKPYWMAVHQLIFKRLARCPVGKIRGIHPRLAVCNLMLGGGRTGMG